MRWIAILSLVIPPILSLISYLYYSIPSYAEDIAFEAVWDNIKIERDQNGIPNIQASSLEDAFFGLGYVHAQDRLFQLDILRRTAEGSLAEILGEDALDIDIFAKNIGFSHHASLSYSDLSNKSKILLKRYTDGINSYAAVNNLPFEFFLTWNHWKAWKPQDCLTVLRYISFFQSAEWGHEFLRYKLIKVLGEETVRNILPYEDDRQFMNHYSINEQEIPSELRYENMVHPSQTKVGKIDHVDSWYENAYYLNQDVSYGFVVSGKYTDSKKPVISTELHISSRVPGNFYLSKISTPSLKLSGSSVTGIPFFYQGSNEDLSWAGLPMLSDTIDIYVHTLNPNDPDLYLSDGKWEKIHKISYKIDIKGENSKEIEIKYTKYGPILENSSVLKQLGSAKLNKGQVMSVRWAGNEVKDTDFDAVMELYHAKNSRDVRRSLEGIKVPNLSFLYATKVGDIGYQSVGAHPKRKFYSVVPLDGSTSDTDWDGFLAYEELPYSLNPYKGYFVIAGNKPISSHYKHSVSLSGSYDDTKSLAISNSIEKIIKNKNFTVSDAVKIQSDNTDLFAKKAVRVLTSNLKQKQSQTIAKIFENWDFSYDKISQQAELFQSWLENISKKLWSSRINDSKMMGILTSRNLYKNWILNKINQDPSDFCKVYKAKDDCEEIIEKSLIEAYDNLENKSFEIINVDLPMYKVLKSLFQRRNEIMSDPYKDYGSANRLIYDLGHPESSLWISNYGVSGNILSKFHNNFQKSYKNHQLEPIFSNTSITSSIKRKN